MSSSSTPLPSYDDHAPTISPQENAMLRSRVEMEVAKQAFLRQQAELEELRQSLLKQQEEMARATAFAEAEKRRLAEEALLSEKMEQQRRMDELYASRMKSAQIELVEYAKGKIPEVAQYFREVTTTNKVLYLLQRTSCEQPWGYITSKGLYQYVNWDAIHPLYQFDHELTDRDISLLDQLFNEPSRHSPYRAYGGNIITRMFGKHGCGPSWMDCTQFQEASKKFESIIRLIPGKYYNGEWQQLDGFFGMYYHPIQNKLLDAPPPQEKQ
jgi:hypothetical protein